MQRGYIKGIIGLPPNLFYGTSIAASLIVIDKENADPKNDYNLNIPRYIDSREDEDIQNIEAHLAGGIPADDIDALSPYWSAYPGLKDHLFAKDKPGPGYYHLKIANEEIKNEIFHHPEFTAFGRMMNSAQWNCKLKKKNFAQSSQRIPGIPGHRERKLKFLSVPRLLSGICSEISYYFYKKMMHDNIRI